MCLLAQLSESSVQRGGGPPTGWFVGGPLDGSEPPVQRGGWPPTGWSLDGPLDGSEPPLAIVVKYSYLLGGPVARTDGVYYFMVFTVLHHPPQDLQKMKSNSINYVGMCLGCWLGRERCLGCGLGREREMSRVWARTRERCLGCGLGRERDV